MRVQGNDPVSTRKGSVDNPDRTKICPDITSAHQGAYLGLFLTSPRSPTAKKCCRILTQFHLLPDLIRPRPLAIIQPKWATAGRRKRSPAQWRTRCFAIGPHLDLGFSFFLQQSGAAQISRMSHHKHPPQAGPPPLFARRRVPLRGMSVTTPFSCWRSPHHTIC